MNIFPLGFPGKRQAAGEGASAHSSRPLEAPSGQDYTEEIQRQYSGQGQILVCKNTTHRQNVGPFPVMSSLPWRRLFIFVTPLGHTNVVPQKQSLFLFLAMNIQDYMLTIGPFWTRVNLVNPDLPLWVSCSVSISIYSFLTTLLTKCLMFSFLMQNHKEL